MTAYATKFTREGVRDMTNRKPYRTKEQKKEARKKAVMKDGRWVCVSVPVSYHN